MFTPPRYRMPDMTVLARRVSTAPAELDGVAPEGFYATTVYPEYYCIGEKNVLIKNGRMDCCAVVRGDEVFAVEARNVKRGDLVVIASADDGSEGVFAHTDGFSPGGSFDDVFAFRRSRSRETPLAPLYDELAELLKYEREHGFTLWVAGPAAVFDEGAKHALIRLIEHGYVNALFGGNALATHDLEGALFHTALGQDIYSGENVKNGHRRHLETINLARGCKTLEAFIDKYGLTDSVISACIRNNVPFVLAGSIRDDGPLPGVVSDVYEAQALMRSYTERATTLITLASQLHSIATGNMTPGYTRSEDGLRPVYFYAVDAAEFAVNKLADRGSVTARGAVTNVQDFLCSLEKRM